MAEEQWSTKAGHVNGTRKYLNSLRTRLDSQLNMHIRLANLSGRIFGTDSQKVPTLELHFTYTSTQHTGTYNQQTLNIINYNMSSASNSPAGPQRIASRSRPSRAYTAPYPSTNRKKPGLAAAGYSCTHCAQVFSTIAKLRQHADFHHNFSDVLLCKWEDCTHRCETRDEMVAHVRGHWEEVECLGCDEVSGSWVELAEHMSCSHDFWEA